MCRSLYKGVCCSLLVLVPPGAARAQTHEPGHVLEEIVVTADPLRRADDHLARPVDVLNEGDLRRRNVRSIGELVAGEPGVSASDFGQAVSRPVIRGLSGGRVRVLEDGIGTMDLSTISADHAVSTDPLLARQVEIFRGPATLLYGSGASGGLVNVVTDRIPYERPETLQTELRMQYETVSETVAGAGRVRGAAGPLALSAWGILRDANDYRAGGGVVSNSSAESDSIGTGATWLGNRGYLGAAVARSRSDYGIPGDPADAVRIDQEQVRYDVGAALYEPLPGFSEVRTRWGFNDYGHDELEEGLAATRYRNKEAEGRVEILHERLAGWDGVAGIQYRHRDFRATGEEAFLPPSELEAAAIFLLEKRDFGRWHVDLGLRFEHQRAETVVIAREHTVISASGGLRWEYTDGNELGAAITHAQRAPDMEELFAGGPHAAGGTFEIGDPALEDETATNIDVYWQRTTGHFTFTANLFYNHIDGFIHLSSRDLDGDGRPDLVEDDFDGDPARVGSPEADLRLVYQAQADARFYGTELEADMNLFNDRRGDLHLRLWSDYVRGELTGGTDLPRITPWRLGATLDFRRGPLEATLEYMRVHRQDSTGPLESATAGYHMLDVYLGLALGGSAWEATLFARGGNLLNEEARRHTSFLKDRAPLPGRSGMVGVQLAF